MSIVSRIEDIRRTIPEGVKLVAVSKFHPSEAIEEAYGTGQRIFGESRMQELESKKDILPHDIEWHFIGHLQTNKIKYIIPYVHTIHSVDSWKLLSEIDKHAARLNVEVNCLLEIHVAEEDSKFGFDLDGCRKFLEIGEWRELKNAKIAGIMGMATNTDDNNQIRSEFALLKSFFDEIKVDYFKDVESFKEISMGMSHDYQIAIEEGSTMVRVGSSIFGDRN